MILYGNQASDAELVLLYGNCQTPFLARLLAAAREDKGYLCVLNHAPPGKEPEKPTAEQMRRCSLYLEQYDSQPDLSVSRCTSTPTTRRVFRPTCGSASPCIR